MFSKLIVVLVLGALLMSGCGKVAEKAIEQASGLKVDQKSDSVTITGKDGEKTTYGGQIPDVLKDFLAPQGFKAEGGASVSQGSEMVATGSWKGKGSAQAAADFYKSALPGQGWKQEAAMDAGAVVLSFSKGESVANITIMKQGDDVVVNVVLGSSKKNSGPIR